jgi:NitT/TauT family transport system substrate-binding protein
LILPTNARPHAATATGMRGFAMSRTWLGSFPSLRHTAIAALACFAATSAAPALALDKVTVAVNPVSSALPYFIAVDRGYFKEAGIETEMKRIAVPTLSISGMVAGQIDAVAVILAIDAANADIKKPGVITFIALNAQSSKYRMEQFVVRNGYEAKSLADLKGARVACVPGLGNITLAKAALAKAGLKDGDYTLDQLEMAQHINVIKSAQYDAAYTLEPGATMMDQMNIAKTIESGVIANIILGDRNANAYVGGAALSEDFIKSRPDVAKRYAEAWNKALELIRNDPKEARKYLLKNTVTPESVVDTVPLLLHTPVAMLSDQDRRNFQAYVDFAIGVGAVSEKIDMTQFMKAY